MAPSERAGATPESPGRLETDENPADALERGRVTAPGTSVRAHWRVTVLPRDAESDFRSDGLETDGVVLVQIRLENPDPVAQHVRVLNTLDGPSLYPRRRGVPEAGWDRNGFAGEVPAGADRALGYACPAPIETPPIELEQIDEDAVAAADGSMSPAAVVREHGEAVPPTAAVRESATEDGPSVRSEASLTAGSERPEATARTDRTSAQHPDGRTDESPLPGSVVTWLERIERRIVRAERLEGATVPEATTVLAETGGLEPALEEVEKLSADVHALRALATRASDLAERADGVDVPAEPLEELA